MRVPTLFFFLLIGATATNCPIGYTDGADGHCYKWPVSSNDPVSYPLAYQDCAADNAYLVDVANAFENSNIGNMANGSGLIWLGMTCLNDSVSSCLWDNGLPMNYNNFMGSVPAMQNGPCVVMDAYSGKWFSEDCSRGQAKYACKYSPNMNIPYCLDTPFRGKCYRVWNVYTAEQATAACESPYDDFFQSSIHSVGENTFIASDATVKTDYSVPVFLGITKNGTWTDGTPVDYSNYVSNMSDCTTMLFGDWSNSPCDRTSICTNQQSNYCTVTTCKGSSVPKTSRTCKGTGYYSGYGMLYSPGYPEASQESQCVYVITVDLDYKAQLTLSGGYLDGNSTIQLWNGMTNETMPFATVTGPNIPTGQAYHSSTNELRVVYTTVGSQTVKNFWYGHYQPTHDSGKIQQQLHHYWKPTDLSQKIHKN